MGQFRNHIRPYWWWLQNMCIDVKRWAIRKKESTARAHRKRQERLRALLESGKTINVVFEVTGISKWKADSVLRLMMKHPRFNPIVWHVPYNKLPNPEREELEIRQCKDYFLRLGVKLATYPELNAFPADEKPDIIFVHEPYDDLIERPYHKGILKYLFCYMPYSMTNSFSKRAKNQIIPNGTLFFYMESEAAKQQCRQLMDNRGINTVVTGHAMADLFLFSEEGHPAVWKACGSSMKRVIWAPHWTIDAQTCWIYYGTIMQTGDIMLEMAEKYRGQIQFAFKPHPNLYDTLCKHPQWGKERTDEFYAKWREMPNTQYEDGAYTGLFMQSDAMIHDCGSFIQEYLFADKPCMYLKDPENHQKYSVMAENCLKAYQIGITREEIEAFLQMVLRGEDPKAEVRGQLREKYLVPPHGQSAAQNIIDCLLMQERHGRNAKKGCVA